LEGQGREEAKGVSDVVLEYSAFRQRRVQNPEGPGVVLAKHPDRGRGSENTMPNSISMTQKVVYFVAETSLIVLLV
jgi:hypothetical protein